jgi:hypothetical protein
LRRPVVVDLPRLDAVDRLPPDAVERLRPVVAVLRRPDAVERLRDELPDARVRGELLDARDRDVEALPRDELLFARPPEEELLLEELDFGLARPVDAPRLFALLFFFTPAGGT